MYLNLALTECDSGVNHIVRSLQCFNLRTWTERDPIISDPNLPLEAKGEAVNEAAGEALLQVREAEMDKNPIGYMKNLTKTIGDTAERDSIIKVLDRLEKLYPPESNKYLAPNGKPSNLNHAQWYAVRTVRFKKWFGDWQSLAKIA